MNRKKYTRRVKRLKNIIAAWFSNFKKENKSDEDYLLELNEMIVDTNRLGNCKNCGILFEKKGDTCPNCGKKIS